MGKVTKSTECRPKIQLLQQNPPPLKNPQACNHALTPKSTTPNVKSIPLGESPFEIENSDRFNRMRWYQAA